MSKYISIFFSTLTVSIFLYFPLTLLFDRGDYLEIAIYTVGTIIIILLSFLISLVYYLIHLLKQYHHRNRNI